MYDVSNSNGNRGSIAMRMKQNLNQNNEGYSNQKQQPMIRSGGMMNFRQEQPEIQNNIYEDKITVPSNNGIAKIRPQDILMSNDEPSNPSGRIQMINKMNNV